MYIAVYTPETFVIYEYKDGILKDSEIIYKYCNTDKYGVGYDVFILPNLDINLKHVVQMLYSDDEESRELIINVLNGYNDSMEKHKH